MATTPLNKGNNDNNNLNTTNNMNDKDTFAEVISETLFDSFDEGFYIGMMSGTSLDGLDAVICQFSDCFDTSEPTHCSNRIIATHSKGFPPSLRRVLLALCQPNSTNRLAEISTQIVKDYPALENLPESELEWFGWASREYAEFASTVVNELLQKSGLNETSILALGCHGQTVRHRPNLGFSLQLVDPNVIAERTGISVVSDFRRRDMAVGGQGAPLAPAFHLSQFGNIYNREHYNRIVVNLGGISNITVMPAGQPDNVIGYDTGPANMLLDAWYQTHVDSATLTQDDSADDNANDPTNDSLYDKDGAWAKAGEVHHPLLQKLLTHPYFAQPTPKSTGREDFNLVWLNEQIAEISDKLGANIALEDVQATLTAFTVQTLSDAIQAESERLNMHSGDKGCELIVCGGGAYNTNLLAQLAQALPNWEVKTSADYGIAPTWVEAMAFAWLARQTIMGQTGNLPAVTGASKPVVLGQVCFA